MQQRSDKTSEQSSQTFKTHINIYVNKEQAINTPFLKLVTSQLLKDITANNRN